MLFARCQHHIWFGSGFPYAPLKAMLTKISKWSRIQDFFWIASKIESLVVFAIPDIPRKFQKDLSITFWVILSTHRQTNKVWQKHYLLGGGNHLKNLVFCIWWNYRQEYDMLVVFLTHCIVVHSAVYSLFKNSNVHFCMMCVGRLPAC